MTSRLYLIADEQNPSTLLLLAGKATRDEDCQLHLYLRYNWYDNFEKEIDFTKSFACLVDVVGNCGYLNMANVFKNCYIDAHTSYETGFITFKKGDDFTFSFAFILDEVKNQSQNLLRISGTVKKSILAEDNDLLGYLLSLNI